MKKLAIYKETEGGKMHRVHFMPEDKTENDIAKAIKQYNATQSLYTVSCAIVPDELYDAIDYLINDRRVDVNRHLKAIDGLRDDIDNMSCNLDFIMSELKNTLKK